jgi:hypothetical protein
MINNELKTLIIEFLDNKNIDFKILDNSFTLYLNNYLKGYWQGSTSKINWSKVCGNSLLIDFKDNIDHDIVQKSLINANFKVLKSNYLVLYFSGNEAVFRIHKTFFTNYLYDFMDEFAFLDSILLFDYEQAISKTSEINFVEVRILDYIAGNN